MSVNCSVSGHLNQIIDRIVDVKSLGDLESSIVEYLRESIHADTDVAVKDIAQALVLIGKNPDFRDVLLEIGGRDIINGWLSIENATNWILDRIHPGESSTQDDSSKIDNLDIHTEQEDLNQLSASFLVKKYGGNSTAKADLLRRFNRLVTSMFFVRLDGNGEVRTQADLEANITKSINDLYKRLVKAAQDCKLPTDGLPKILIHAREKTTRENWAIYKSVSQQWKSLLESKPTTLNDIAINSKSGDKLLKDELEVIQNDFILNHFDELLLTQFKDGFKIKGESAGQFTGVTFNGIHKYVKADGNHNLRVSWTSDEEQSSAVVETSQQLKAFFDGLIVTSLNASQSEKTTSTQEIADTWVKIIAQIRQSPIPIKFNTGEELDAYLTPHEKDLLAQCRPNGNGFGIADATLQELARRTSDPEMMRLFFKVLGYDGNSLVDMKMSIAQRSLIHTIYNEIFSTESPFYKSFVHSQSNPVIGNAPKNYYEWFSGFFSNLSMIPMGETYLDADTGITQRNKAESGVDSGAYAKQSQINATYSATVDFTSKGKDYIKRTRNFTLNPSELTTKNKYIDIHLPGYDSSMGTPNMTIRRFDTGSMIVYDEFGKEVDLANLVYNSSMHTALQDFYFEVLGLQHYERRAAETALGDNGLHISDLLDLATDVLYNYSVSYNLADKPLSSAEYLKEAGNYFSRDELKPTKVQSDASDLNGISKRNTGRLTSLLRATDFLEGRVRDAVNRSADGTNINVISTSQLAYSAYDQWMRALAKGDYACEGFSLIKAFKGLEFGRDVKLEHGENKRVTALSEAEMFARNFIAGYLTPTVASVDQLYRIIPLVISDKSRIPDARIDMLAINPLNGKAWKDCSEQEIREATIAELGGYYQKAFTEFKKRFGILHNALLDSNGTRVVKSFGSDEANSDVDFYLTNLATALAKNKSLDFGYSNGFAEFNAVTKQFKAKCEAEFDAYFLSPTATFDRTSKYFDFITNYAVEETHVLGHTVQEVQMALIQGHQEFMALDEAGREQAIAKWKALKKAVKSGEANSFELSGNPLYQFIKFREAGIDSITDRAKTAIGNVFHELAVHSKQLGNPVTLPANSSYVMTGDANIYVNPVLVDQLYRWDIIKSDKEAQRLLPPGLSITSGEGKADAFFKHKAQQTLKNVLQDGGVIKLSGQAKTALTSEDSGQQIKFDGIDDPVAVGEHMVLGVISYPARQDGEIVIRTERLFDKYSIEDSYILKQAFNYKKYHSGNDSFNFNSAAEWFESPEFNFTDFEQAASAALELREKLIGSKKAFDEHWKEKEDQLIASLNLKTQKGVEKRDKAIAKQKVRISELSRSGSNRDLAEAQQYLDYLVKEKEDYLAKQNVYIKDRLAEFAETKRETAKEYKDIKKSSKPIKDFTVKVHVNPYLSRYNAISFMFGQEYTIATVGSHINHPGIKAMKDGLIAMEALCFQQQTKRNVSLTATKNKYHLNRWDGLSEFGKICIISNTKDAVYNLTGTRDEVFNDDGACYTSGPTHYWENASLGSNAVGIDKKTFFHMHDSKTGTGYIGKDAGFTANNNRIRDSLFYAYLNYRGLSDPDNELAPYLQGAFQGLDITHRFGFKQGQNTQVGEIIKFPNFSYEKVIVKDKNGIKVPELNFVELTGTWDKIPENATITVRGNTVKFDPSTGITSFDATVDGNVFQMQTVLKNVHDIWKFFGGAYSGKATNGVINSEDYDDSSMQYTAEVCNLVGERINGTGDNDIIESQSQVNQYLKKSVVYYMPTVESVKQGASNVNDVLQLNNFGYAFASMEMDLNDSGVQLNAEHHADDTVISMMTQVLNALGARGYTAQQGDRTYQALRALTETNLKDYIDWVINQNAHLNPTEETRSQLNNFLAQIITKTIRSADLDDGTLVAALTFQARKALEDKAGNLNYDEIVKYIPIDDLGLLRGHISKISSQLVKSCIKVKFPGSMDVLSPSNGRFLLYDGKLLSQYKGDFKALQEKDRIAQSKAHRNTHAIRLGTTYRLSLGKSNDLPLDLSTFMLGTVNADGTVDVKINTPAEYWAVQDFMMRNPEVRISEVFSVGRDLAAYGVTFLTEGPTPEQYNIWDLASVHDLYNESMTGTKEQKKEALRKLQEVLGSISSDPNFEYAEVRYFDAGEWKTKRVKVDKKSINVAPYEVIMSMHDEKQFGLRAGDDVKTISENKLFFLDRFIKQNFDKEGDNDKYFDFELRPMREEDKVWISLEDKPVDTNYFTPISGNIYEDASNPNDIKYWQLNYEGEKVRRLYSKQDRVYKGAGGETLIVTNNPEFYLDNTQHTSLTISTRIAERDPDRLIEIFDKHLMKTSNGGVKSFLKKFKMRLEDINEEDIDEENVDVSDFISMLGKNKDTVASELQSFINAGRQRFIESIKEVQNVIDSNDTSENKLRILLGKDENGKSRVKDAKVRRMIESTLETHTSFLKSLEVLAARIPAQCMQSFMAMKIAGFDRSGVNTAYVSRFQIYLQGSDFDIDKVSLLGFKFRNGKFVTWSPFMDISSIENLEASLDIPFPTGRKVYAVEDSAKRCTLGDSILYGLHSGVEKTEDGKLRYVMTNTDGNVLFSLDPIVEIDPRYEELPKIADLWTMAGQLTAIATDTPEQLNATLLLLSKDGYTITDQYGTRTLKVREFIPEDILNAIESGDNVNLVKLRSSIINGVKEAAAKYGAGEIKGYKLALNNINISDPIVRKAIQRSLVYITREGQSLITENPEVSSMLSEYGFDIGEDGVVTRSNSNISAASDFLSFIEANVSKDPKHPGLFIRGKNGKYVLNTGVNYRGNKVEHLHKLATFIQAVNDFGGIPQFGDGKHDGYDNSIEDILKEINNHNLSLSKNSSNLQDALINFISTSMYSISKNPINQIQAQSSVDASDGTVKITKDMAKKSEYSKKLVEFNPGSVTSIFRMTKLTLGGKTNVGITASSLKTFEALTQYTYNTLNRGTAERISALLSNCTFVGQNVRMIANPYQQNKQNFLPFDTYLALQEAQERFDFDAYLWYSGILSLSTDNAKDPTTVKINAGDKTISLYLAGLAVGVDMQALIPIMTSRAGVMITQLMESNIFTGQTGLFDVASVIRYIDNPEGFIKTLNNETLKLISEKYIELTYTKGMEVPSIDDLVKDSKFQSYLLANSETIIRNRLKVEHVKESEKSALRNGLREITKYNTTRKTILNCSIEYEGNTYYPFNEIKKLNDVLQEMRIFSQIGRLNQTLPNTIAEQLVWKEKFESAIAKRMNNMSAREKADPKFKRASAKLTELNKSIGVKGRTNLSKVNFLEFVENPEYRQGIIEVYDDLKVVVNPYAAMSELSHYFGYMQTAAAMFRANEASNIYQTAEYIIGSLYKLSGTEKEKTNQVSRVLDWISNSMTASFMRESIPPIKVNLGDDSNFRPYLPSHTLTMQRKKTAEPNLTLVLGDDVSNATFKVLMEEVIIPKLQESHVNNALLDGLTPTKFDKTYDKNFIVKIATATSGSPKADFELESLSKYKVGLSALVGETIDELDGMNAIDALFLYNLIVNGGKVSQTSLSMVFEDYARSQGKTDETYGNFGSSLIADYYNSRRIRENSLLEEIEDMSSEAKKKLAMAMATVDFNFTSGKAYIIHQNPATRKYELLYSEKNQKKQAKIATESEEYVEIGLDASDFDYNDDLEEQISQIDSQDVGPKTTAERYEDELDKYGYKRVGIFNSGKAMQAMIVSPSFEDTKIAELLYENPITGEIRVKYQGKLLKYKDLVDMMTPKAKESLKAKNMKELLRAAGFIKGSNKITPGKMLGSVDDLIKYLTEEQC